MLPDGESLILSFSSRPPTFQRQLKAWKSENVKTQFTKERIITKDTPQCLTDKCQDIKALPTHHKDKTNLFSYLHCCILGTECKQS